MGRLGESATMVGDLTKIMAELSPDRRPRFAKSALLTRLFGIVSRDRQRANSRVDLSCT